MSTAVSVGKDLFSLIRDLALSALLLLLLFSPETFKSTMTAAGVRKATLGGFEWEDRLLETNGELRATKAALMEFEKRNRELEAGLEEAKAKATSAEQKEQLGKLQQEANKTTASAAEVQVAVQETLAANDAFILSAGARFTKGYCYQQDYKLAKDPRGRDFGDAERYAIHCHETKENCEIARGGTAPRPGLSACQAVSRASSQWTPTRRGYLGSWFDRRDKPHGLPFPQLPQ